MRIYLLRLRKTNKRVNAGVPVPTPAIAGTLRNLLGEHFDLSNFVRSFPNLEKGMAAFASKLGLGVHLVDYYDAVDEHEAMVIIDKEYQSVSMSDWIAIVFS